MDLKKRIFGHFVNDKYHAAYRDGIRGTWVNVDTIGGKDGQWLIESCRHYPDWRFILFIFLTEDRLKNQSNAWESMRVPIQWIRDLGIHHQCAGIQFDDEFWSRLYGGMSGQHAPLWPSLGGLSQGAKWDKRWEFAIDMDQRAWDLRKYWSELIGGQCPPIGVAESGGCVPPQFVSQEWWGLNVYHMLNGYLESPNDVHFVYSLAWNYTKLPIMPVIPIFREGTITTPSTGVLANTYMPIIMHPSTWNVGVFAYDPPSPPIDQGVYTMDQSYRDGLKWLHQKLNT